VSRQELWDRLLVASWDKDVSMNMCIQQLHANGVDFDDDTMPEIMDSLLRAPVCKAHLRMCARAFVASTMDWLNNFLWDHYGEDRTELLKKLSASKYGVTETNEARQWKNEKQKERRRRRSTRVVYDSHPDSDWKLNKPVRSK
jgi:hypothetical protein